MATEPIQLNATECAKRIRADLKAAFPGVKFSVRSSYFSQGSAVDVRYAGGPPEAEVQAIMNAYGGRGFDGTDDSTFYKKGAGAFRTYAFLQVQRDRGELEP